VNGEIADGGYQISGMRAAINDQETQNSLQFTVRTFSNLAAYDATDGLRRKRQLLKG
jgi:hypothetical protein